MRKMGDDKTTDKASAGISKIKIGNLFYNLTINNSFRRSNRNFNCPDYAAKCNRQYERKEIKRIKFYKFAFRFRNLNRIRSIEILHLFIHINFQDFWNNLHKKNYAHNTKKIGDSIACDSLVSIFRDLFRGA